MHAIVLAAAANHHSLHGLAGLAAKLMDTLGQVLGGAGAAVANGLDSILPFLPSEVILPLAGVSASQGHMSLVAAIIWTTIGSMVGSTVMYYIGVWLGRDRARSIISRIPLVKPKDVDRAEAWFNKHGTKAVFFGRMMPLVRGMISIPAGVERMNYGLFLLYTTAGSLIWNALFVVLGFQLGQKWYLIDRYAGLVTKLLVIAFVVAVTALIVFRVVVRRRRSARLRRELAAQQALRPCAAAVDR